MRAPPNRTSAAISARAAGGATSGGATARAWRQVKKAVRAAASSRLGAIPRIP